jgi:hypothetical protein
MSRRNARILGVVFFLANVVAVTWPGLVPFNRVRPFVLGLPFVMVWLTIWVLAAMIVLLVIDRAEHGDSED